MKSKDKHEAASLQGASSRAVHGGAARDKGFHAMTTPIVQSATYTFANTAQVIDFLDKKVYGGELDREEYARYGNPSVWSLEARLADLEDAEDAVVYPSGHVGGDLALSHGPAPRRPYHHDGRLLPPHAPILRNHAEKVRHRNQHRADVRL